MAGVIRRVEQSALLNGELGVRPRVSLQEWMAASAEERSAVREVGTRADRSPAVKLDEARANIRLLAASDDPRARATLQRLWRECPVQPVRVAAGHALFDSGDSAARDLLAAGIGDHEHIDRFLALKVMFTSDNAWELIAPLSTEERLATGVATEALAFFSPSAWGNDGPRWILDEPRRAALLADDRWIRLCIDLRHHEVVGRAARSALANLPAGVGTSLLDAAAQERRADPVPRRYPAGPVVTTYGNGDRVGAWRDLREAAPLTPAGRRAAGILAEETMGRLLEHLRILVADLIEAGWPIDADEALPGPTADLEETLGELEQLIGMPVPAALAAFWRIVGPVDLVPPAGAEVVPEGLRILDPLQILDLEDSWFSVEEWQEEVDGVHPEIVGPLPLALSADHLHKADISGGGPYCIWLPDENPDPPFREEKRRLAFTDYLRLAVAGHGFARAEHADEASQLWLTSLPVRGVDF